MWFSRSLTLVVLLLSPLLVLPTNPAGAQTASLPEGWRLLYPSGVQVPPDIGELGFWDAVSLGWDLINGTTLISRSRNSGVCDGHPEVFSKVKVKRGPIRLSPLGFDLEFLWETGLHSQNTPIHVQRYYYERYLHREPTCADMDQGLRPDQIMCSDEAGALGTRPDFYCRVMGHLDPDPLDLVVSREWLVTQWVDANNSCIVPRDPHKKRVTVLNMDLDVSTFLGDLPGFVDIKFDDVQLALGRPENREDARVDSSPIRLGEMMQPVYEFIRQNYENGLGVSLTPEQKAATCYFTPSLMQYYEDIFLYEANTSLIQFIQMAAGEDPTGIANSDSDNLLQGFLALADDATLCDGDVDHNGDPVDGCVCFPPDPCWQVVKDNFQCVTFPTPECDDPSEDPAIEIVFPTQDREYTAYQNPVLVELQLSHPEEAFSCRNLTTGQEGVLFTGRPNSFHVTTTPGSNRIRCQLDVNGEVVADRLLVHTPPIVNIVVPTSDENVATLSDEMLVSAAVDSNEEIPSVFWYNTRNEVGGQANPGYGWMANVPLVAGSNPIVFLAQDARGLLSADQLVAWSGTSSVPPLALAPSVNVLSPQNDSTSASASVEVRASVTAGGSSSASSGASTSAASSAAIDTVKWSNVVTGQSGEMTDGVDWSAQVPLESGLNPLTVTAWDTTGLSGLADVRVRFDETQPPLGEFNASVSCSYLYGWACDPDDFDASVEVELYEGFDLVGVATANGLREDRVAEACGEGHSSHGFVIPIPDSLKDSSPHELTAYARDLGGDGRSVLDGNPVSILCDPHVATNRLPIGVVDGNFNCDHVFGWTCDPDEFDAFLEVDVEMGGSVIGTVLADSPREVAVGLACGIEHSAHGFQFPIPSELKDGGAHELRFRAQDSSGTGQRLLSGNPHLLQCGVESTVPRVTIVLPVGDPFATDEDHFLLIAIGQDDETPAAGLTLRWSNTTTGESGIMNPGFGWMQNIDLALGDNLINVTAQDEHGDVGLATLTVIHDPDAGPPGGSHSPAGGINATSSCVIVKGWACDEDDFSIPLNVEIREGENVHASLSADAIRGSVVASNCGGNPAHGFDWPVPPALFDGEPHVLTAYAQHSDGSSFALLPNNNAITLQCGGTPPTLNFVLPAVDPFDTAESTTTVAVAGSSDVTSGTWSNAATGVSGDLFSGYGLWIGGNLALAAGDNLITVTLRTDALTETTDTVLVKRDTNIHEPDGGINALSDCELVKGWTCDADDYASALTVEIREGSTVLATRTANILRGPAVADECGGNAAHGFEWTVPATLKNGVPRTLTAYARHSDGSSFVHLPRNNPIVLQCDGGPPTVSVTVPASDPYDTVDATVNVGVVASDDVGVTGVTWANARTGQTGEMVEAFGGWVIAIPVELGDNAIGVTARDAVGNTATDSLTIRRAAANLHPPAGGVNATSDCELVKGWTCDPDDYGASLQVEIREGSTLRATLTADAVRGASVAGNCGGDAAHGFDWSVPASLRDGSARTFTAYARHSDGSSLVQLPNNNPVTLQCGTPPVPDLHDPAGGINGMSDCELVKGWTCDADDYSVPLEVQIREGSTVRANLMADVTLGPAVENNCGGFGQHGFEWNVPASLRTGTDRNFRAYARSVGQTAWISLPNNNPVTVSCQP